MRDPRPLLLLLVLFPWVLASPLSGGVVLEGGPPIRDAVPGGTATFTVSITDSSTLPASVRLSLVGLPSGWRSSIDPPNHTLSSGERRTSLVTLFVPENAPLSETPTLVRFQVVGEEARTGDRPAVNFTVRLPSAPKRPPPSAFEAELRPDSLTTRSGDPFEGSVILRNVGDSPVALRLGILHPSGWTVGLDRISLSLPARSVDRVFLKGWVPSGRPESNESILLRVEGESSSVSLTLFVHVLPEEPDTSSPPPNPPPKESRPETTPPPSRPSPSDPPSPPPSPPPTLLVLVESPLSAEPGRIAGGKIVVSSPTVEEVSLSYSLPVDWKVEMPSDRLTLVGGRGESWIALHVPPNANPETSIEGVLVVRDSLDPRTVAAAAFLVQVEGPKASPQPPILVEGGVPDPHPAPPSVDTFVSRILEITGSFPRSISPILLEGAAAVASLGALVALLRRNETFRIFFGGLLSPLYTRLEKPQVLSHSTRARILQAIESHPGIHFRALERTLGLRTGALVHHLRVLERESLIVTRRDGFRRRYFLPGAKGEGVPLEGIQGEILRIVSETPGIQRSAVAGRLGISRQLLHYHLKALSRRGVVLESPKGRLSPRPDSSPSDRR